MSSVSGGGWLGTDQPAVLDALSFSKIITLEDKILRYPRNIYASFMSETSVSDICAVINAEKKV